MAFLTTPLLQRREQATLKHGYGGEMGRGAYAACYADLPLTIAIFYFSLDNPFLLAFLPASGFVGLLVALFATSLTAHHRKKSVLFALEVMSRLILLGAAFVTTGVAFALVVGLSMAIGALGVPLVSGIYGTNFRTSTRGWAVGRLHAVSQGTTALAAVGVGYALDLGLGYYRVVLAVAAVVGLAGSWWAYYVPEPLRHSKGSRRAMFRDFWGVLFKDRAFAYAQLVWFVIGYSNLALFPMRVIHLKEINLEPSQIIFATTAVIFGTQVLTTALWGRVIYRMNFAVYRIIISLAFIVGMLVFFYGKTFPVVCLGSFIWALGLAGGTLSWRLIATLFTTPNRVTLYMSVHTFLCGIRGIAAPFIVFQQHSAHSVQYVANLSVIGLTVSILMLLPFIPMMRKRQDAINGA